MQFGPFEGTLAHYHGYRYVLAVENTDVGSPVSEKIVNAVCTRCPPPGPSCTHTGRATTQVYPPCLTPSCRRVTRSQFLSGAIPIVWGGGAHKQVFNPASYIDCTALSPDGCARAVLALDADPVALDAVRQAPRFIDRAAFDSLFAWHAVSKGSSLISAHFHIAGALTIQRKESAREPGTS